MEAEFWEASLVSFSAPSKFLSCRRRPACAVKASGSAAERVTEND